ncbi:unnamed protein product [Musa textilis]
MLVSRVLGRVLCAAYKSESFATSAAAAAVDSARKAQNPLEEFFEADRSTDEEKPVVYGRGWKASELRLKSWDDLQKLWYVLLKEKNMLMTQRQMLNAQNLRFPNPERIPKSIIFHLCHEDKLDGSLETAQNSCKCGLAIDLLTFDFLSLDVVL